MPSQENVSIIISKLKSSEFVLQSVSNRKSKVWDSFQMVIEKESKQALGYVQCVKCQKLLVYNGSAGGSSHLSRHKCFITNQATNSAFVNPKKENFPQNDKQEVLETTMKFCAEDIKPYELIQGAGFLKLAQMLIDVGATYGNIDVNSVLSDSTTISRHVTQTASKLRKEILCQINEAMVNSRCASSINVWTDDYKKMSYLSLTIYYINDDWNLINKVLFTSSFSEDLKTAENIREELLRQFLKLGYDSVVVQNINFVTNQGANVVKALKNCNRYSCVPGILNTVLCYAFNSKFLEENASEFHSALLETKELVTFLKESALATELKHTIEQGVETSWNSKLLMLNSVLDQYDDIKTVLSKRDFNHKVTSKYILRELVNFLQPFKDAIDGLEAEDSPTIQLVSLHFFELQTHLQVGEDDSLNLQRVKKRAGICLLDQFQLLPIHKISIFLCPSFRQLRMFTPAERDEIIANIRDQIKISVKIENTFESVDETLERPLKKRKIGSLPFEEWKDVEPIQKEESVLDEVDFYVKYKLQNDCNDILQWWKLHETQFPGLAKLAKKYLSVPASIASNERNLSFVGRNLSQTGSNLEEDDLEDLLFLNSNLKF